jgi:hypothetical protein
MCEKDGGNREGEGEIYHGRCSSCIYKSTARKWKLFPSNATTSAIRSFLQ